MNNSVTRTQAIKAFLDAHAPSDLAKLYSHDQECQVNIFQGNGEIEAGDYEGHKFIQYRDPIDRHVWKSFRIPFNVNDATPTYNDLPMSFNLVDHAEAIGLSGWNWVTKQTHWVGFDVDSMKSHTGPRAYSEEELKIFEEKIRLIPYADLRRSKSGAGLHVYVHLTTPYSSTKLEHKAIARAILQDMCKMANYNFDYQIDKLGEILWCWHRNTVIGKGLLLIRKGTTLDAPPKYWREHLDVVSNKRRKTRPIFIDSNKTEEEKIFDEVVGRRSSVQRDEEHQKLINWIESQGLPGYWQEDNGLYCTHTSILKEAHKALNLKGIFETIATGKDYGHDLNCFLFPLRNGAWVVRRFSQGCAESNSWIQDKQGYTKCYYNRNPDLDTTCRTFDGNEHTGGGYLFSNLNKVKEAIKSLGGNLEFPDIFNNREIILKKHNKDKRLVIIVKREDSDNIHSPLFNGWTPEKSKWTKILDLDISKPIETQIDDYDNIIRHLVSEGKEDFGWVIYHSGDWYFEPVANVKSLLKSQGLTPYEAEQAIGSIVTHPFIMTNDPFEPEWNKEGRKWNKYAARLKYKASTEEMLVYPTFQKILNHCGQSLDPAVKNNDWCRLNGINNGYDYLFAWCAWLFQRPKKPLPYLFFFGAQNSGKSSFHHMLSMLLINGVVRAEQALTSAGGFNAELEFALLSIVEEINLKKSRTAYERIKDWVTSNRLSVHRKGATPYLATNTNHFIHAANDSSACPVFGGDTRVTMSYVAPLTPEELIPQHILEQQLDKEAPDFLAAIKLRYQLPETNDRLGIPALLTDAKEQAEQKNLTAIEEFLKEECYYVDGEAVLYSELYHKFFAWLDPKDRPFYSLKEFRNGLPDHHPKGRFRNAQFHIGNISFENKKAIKPKLILCKENLVYIDGKKYA